MDIAVRVHRHGGPEVLALERVDLSPPGAGEALVAHAAIGVNFRDIYDRRGVYPMSLPSALGLEGAGVVEAIGEEVRGVSVGDRVAYGIAPRGAYATRRVVPASSLIRLPPTVGFEVAAALMLKGMTAEYLAERCVSLARGDRVLLHSAAGGVGTVMCQWLTALGVEVIGTIGDPSKTETARAAGCAAVVVRRHDWAGEVLELTDGRGVAAAFDSIGRATFASSLACLARRGTLVAFGASSGPPDPVDVTALLERGSVYLTRPGLNDYVATRAELEHSSERVFEMLERGVLGASIGARWPLAEVKEAHRAIESGATTGSSILIP